MVYLLFDGARGEQSVDGDLSLLPNPPCTLTSLMNYIITLIDNTYTPTSMTSYLRISAGVPVRVVDDDAIGSC